MKGFTGSFSQWGWEEIRIDHNYYVYTRVVQDSVTWQDKNH
jgi:hypothetical protein